MTRPLPSTCLLLALFGLGAWQARSAPDDRFHGGSGDGSASAMFTGYTPPTAGQFGRFVGAGGFDGYASARFEGYTPPMAGEFGRFAGDGGFDGYASARFESFTPPMAGDLGRFAGGGFDGYGSAIFRGYTPPIPGAFGRFAGGGFDGADSGAVTGIANPLNGDVDGDRVPDWWEAGHYFSLTLAGTETDVDGDGLGSLREYIADTDPVDPLSRLVILSVEHGDSIRVEFGTSSVNRVYSMEASTDLSEGSWSTATPSPVIGSGGTMEISTADIWAGAAFFRISVAFPE